MIWCFGACLFSHAATSISVAYFDQSMLYFWLSVAVISSVYSILRLGAGSAEPDPEVLDSDNDDIDDAESVARANAEWRRRLWERMAGDAVGRPGEPR
jgi:hypothetical protein